MGAMGDACTWPAGASQYGQVNADGSDQHPLLPAGTLDELKFQFDGMGERMISWR